MMTGTTLLRVGICRCNDYYQGRLGGKRLVINGNAFELQEVLVRDKEKEQELDLEKFVCNFFLDTHRGNSYYFVGLDINDLAFVGGRLKLHRGFLVDGNWVGAGMRRWYANKPPPIEEIIETILAFLDIEERRLCRWLSRLSQILQKGDCHGRNSISACS